MIVEFNKFIYDKKLVYQSLEEWKDYMDVLEVKETSNFLNIFINDKTSSQIISEFVNYVLDLCSLQELSQ